MSRKLHPLPHVVGAMKMDAVHNLCVHRAAGFVLDTPGATLCFGTFIPDPAQVQPGESTVPFIHAWPEWRGRAWAVSTIERNGGIADAPVEEYYRVNNAKDIYRLPRPALLRVAKAIGLSRHLLKHQPTKGGASVGGTLLAAAGVPHRVAPDGALLPLESDNAETN